MSVDLKLCKTIDAIAENISQSLLLLPPKQDKTKIKLKKTYEGDDLTEEEMCKIILKYKDCFDFDTLPIPEFFYKKYPEYYDSSKHNQSLEQFLGFIEDGEQYKKCKNKEERRLYMKEKIVANMCEFYALYNFLPSYEDKFTEGTDYELYNRETHQQLELEKEGQEEPALDLETETDYDKQLDLVGRYGT